MKKIFFSSLLVLLTMLGIAPTVQAQSTPQYGVELLTNIPPAATNFTGWTTSGSVECKEGWFKTGNSVSTISQTIDLAAKGYTTPVAENTFFIYAAAEYCEYWGGSAIGVAKVYVEFLDENGNVLAADSVLNRENYSGYVDITRVSNKFVIPANTKKVRYVLQGKDQKNWGGCYGPWFRNMSCKVFDYTKVGTSVNVSVDAALGDSITLSKTSDFLYGDTITVTANYPEHPILWLTFNEGQLLEDNQLICWGTDIVVGAQLKYDHTISLNATHATIISNTTKAGMGDTITLSYTMEEGYYFVEYTTDVEVDWIDANRFIMPDANITIGVKFIAPNSLPYFEGFENGNSQDAHIEGWAWQKEGSNDWLANTSNTDFNQKPYEGSWNATLEFNNAAWLFQAFTFEKGKKYCISFYARTYDSATLRVMLGNSNHKDSMQVTLIPNTSVSMGNYKKISGAIKVEKDGNYVIGIRGYMNSARNALSIDNVVVEEAQAHAITLNGMHATLTADKASAYIGDTVTLSSSMEYGYALGRYTTNINVTWIDANRFIMPDENVAVGNTAITVKSLPYFEGFEDGNTQGSVVADWLQQSENGSNSWVANSTNTNYNRTPYAGSWNAYLYGYNTDWLFQALTLEAGKTYAFSMRARSYYSAKILVKLGNQTNKDAMSVTIVPETTLSTTDYQYLSGKFTVETTGIYVIGIRGYSTNSSNYTSIDNIQVRESQPHAITLNGTHATLTADKTEASIGDTVTLSYTFDENYVWGNYTTNINVTWIDDHRFIMPDEDVVVGNVAITPKSLPYFEGFENGNTQDAVIADWLQQSEYGDAFWGANSTNIDFNRTPYAGSRWNATLLWGNTDWLFQAIALEAGENYVLSLYARQDMQDPSYANITAALGTAFNKDAMTTTLIPETGLTNGDYQLLTDTFQVAETKPYVLGIRGYISGSPYYISMDNILVEQEVYPASVDTLYFDVLTEDAARTALAALSLPAQDTKGNTKCTITNLPENWVLDLENKKATYTAADNLLPMGYFFSNTTATITVALQLNTYSLSFATNDAAMGSVSSTHKADTYDYGTEVMLTATANEHYHFVQWSDGTKDATYTFTLTQDTTLTAEFAINQHTLTIGEAENGSVKVAVDGKDTTATTFDYGTKVTLTATANEHYHFVQWSDGTKDATYTFTLTGDTTLTAEFAIDQHTVTIGEAENGSVTGAGTYDYNTEVTLTATPAEHYHFVKWSNGATDATYTFPLTSDTTLTAEFAIDQHTVTLGEAVNGSVTGAGTYDYNTEVTLTATPAKHYHFVKWSNGATAATYTFTLTGDTTLTAEFAIDQHTITIGDAENGSVKVAVDGKDTTVTTFDYGTVLTLTATANVGYSFEKWSDDNTDNPRVITLTEDIAITAIFKEDAPMQLTETNVETKVQKVMRNGQVFIIRNGNTYDLTGRKTE